MTLLRAIEMFERVMVTSTEHLMKEMNADSNTLFQELTKEQHALLKYVYMKGNVSPGDLAKFQGIQKSTLSNRLNKLISGEYLVYGQNSLDDKRYRSLQMTEKGKAIVEKNKEKSFQVFQELFEDVGNTDEIETFIKLLTKIQKQIDTKGVK